MDRTEMFMKHLAELEEMVMREKEEEVNAFMAGVQHRRGGLKTQRSSPAIEQFTSERGVSVSQTGFDTISKGPGRSGFNRRQKESSEPIAMSTNPYEIADQMATSTIADDCANAGLPPPPVPCAAGLLPRPPIPQQDIPNGPDSSRDSKEDTSLADFFEEEVHEVGEDWKERYYSNKFGLAGPDNGTRELSRCYVEGLLWVLHYYYDGVVSWNWFFPYNYAPLLADLNDLSEWSFDFTLGQPFKPLQQLLAVLPPASGSFLPKPYRELMTSKKSPLLDMYPTDFEIDQEGCSAPWEGIVKLPFLDEARMLEALAAIPDSLLTDDEITRNTLRDAVLVTFDAGDKSVLRSTMPSNLPDLNPAQTNIVYYKDQDYPPGTKVFLVDQDEDVDVLKSPGFVCLTTGLQFTHSTYMAGVNVFGSPSRKESTVIRVTDEVHPEKNIEEIKDEWLNKPCFVGWPYLTEALVVGMSDGKNRISGNSQQMTRESIENFNHQLAEQKHHDLHRGLDCGESNILLYVRLFEGMHFTGNGTYRKSYSSTVTTCAYKIAMKPSRAIAFDPRFSEQKKQTLREAFPLETTVLYCGNPHFGSISKIVGYGANQTLDIEVRPAAQDRLHGGTIAAAEDKQYMSSLEACRALKISNQMLSSISASVFINCNPGKADVGLRLKFSGKQLQALGYTRRKNEHDGWEYSQFAIKLLADYKAAFPRLFHFLEHATNMKAYDAADVFPGGKDKETIAAIMAWHAEKGITNVKLVPCSRISLSRQAIQAIERGNDAFHKKNTESSQNVQVLRQVKPSLVIKPMTQICAPRATTFSLGDRVINVRLDNSIPFGLRGTVVGFQDHMLELVMDAQVLGASNLDGVCGALRGLRVPMTAVLNLQTKSAPTPAARKQIDPTTVPFREQHGTTANTLSKENRLRAEESKRLHESLIKKPRGDVQPAQQKGKVMNPNFREKASWEGMDASGEIALVPNQKGNRLVKHVQSQHESQPLAASKVKDTGAKKSVSQNKNAENCSAEISTPKPKPKPKQAAQQSKNTTAVLQQLPLPPIPLPGGMMMLPNGMVAPMQQNCTPIPSQQDADPEEESQALGEQLYLLIEQTHPDLAGKLTGMFLELDTPTILKLIHSPEMLQAHLVEAIAQLEQGDAPIQRERKLLTPQEIEQQTN